MDTSTPQATAADRTPAGFPSEIFMPMARWANGFDYAFGYQLRLFWDFWGITHDGR